MICPQFNNNIREVAAGSATMRVNQPRNTGKRSPKAKSHKLLDKASTQNLFVARLPRHIDNDALMALFADFCPTSAVVMMDMESGQSKGFGFVTFASEEEGKVAMEVMQTRSFSLPTPPGSAIMRTSPYTLEIKPSTFNGNRIVIESRYLYFRNFPNAVLQGGVEHFFLERFGRSVSNVQLHSDCHMDTLMAPAFLVAFATQADASYVMAACHGKVLFPELSSIPVMAKYADMITVKKMDHQLGTCTPGTAISSPSTPLSTPGLSNESSTESTNHGSWSTESLPNPCPFPRRQSPVVEQHRPALLPVHAGLHRRVSTSSCWSNAESVDIERISPPVSPGVVYCHNPYNLSGYTMMESSSSSNGSGEDDYYHQ